MPPTPAESRIFGFLDFSENVDFWDFPMGFGVWEGLQSIGNACGLHIHGFSTHFEPSESIFNDFHDFGHFSVVSGGLMLFSEGPRTFRKFPEGPGNLSQALATSSDLSQPLPSSPKLSETLRSSPKLSEALQNSPKLSEILTISQNSFENLQNPRIAVSYTHLTLPTILRV